jgi:hypothetical protein
MQKKVDYLEFLEQLRGSIETRETATVRLITDDRHFVNIGIEGGQIVAVYHGPRRGLSALKLICTIQSGALSILSTHEFARQADLPPTTEILRLLEQRAQQAAPRIDGDADQRQSPDSNPQFSADIKHVEQALMQYIGPIARMLVEQTVQDIGGVSSNADLTRLVEQLSGEIDMPKQAKHFIDQALQRT